MANVTINGVTFIPGKGYKNSSLSGQSRFNVYRFVEEDGDRLIFKGVSMPGERPRLFAFPKTHNFVPHDSVDVDDAHSKWTTDDNEPLKQKVEATLERTGLRSAVNAIYGKYPSKIGLDIDPSKSTEIVSVLKKDFSKVIYNSDTFEVVIGDALGFASVEVPKKIAEELMLGWDIDRLCKDFHLNVTKQSSSYYFVGESSWIDKFYKAYGLDQFGIRIKDSAPVADSKIEYVFNDGKIVGGEGRSMDGIPYGLYQEGGRSYRGFEITSSENGLRKGVYRFYNWGGGVPFGNSAVDGQFTEAQFQKLIQEGKVKLLDSISVADKNWEVGKRVRMYGEYWIVINFSRGDWILESEKTKEQIRVSDSTTTFGMEDDIVKSGSGYTNKGKEGTHGQFATKKEAAAQTRAMYANGYKGDATEKEFKIYVKGPFGSYKVAEWSAVSKEAAVKEFLEMNPAYKNKGIIEARDAATVYAPIVDEKEPKYKKGDKVKYEGKTYYVAGVRGERDGVTFYHLTESKELDGVGRFNAAETKITHADAKMFKVADARTVRASMLSAGRKIVGDEDEVWTVVSVKKDGGGVEVAVKNDKGERDNWYFESSEQVPLADSVVADAKTEYVFNWRDTYHGTRERTRVDANSVGEAILEFEKMIALGGVGTANAFVISVSPNDGYVALYGKVSDLVKKFKDSVHVCDVDVKVGQQYQNARLSTLTVTNITNSGNVEWQFSRGGDVYGAPVSGFKAMLEKNGYRRIKDSTKMFKVVDKATGKTLLVKATDSLAAVMRVSSLKDTAYTVTARTNDFPYGNNVAVIVDANSEDEAVAKCRKVFEARGDKINHISATPTTSSDIAKGISRFKN